MRRADRLFQIVQYLRGGRLVTAAMLAERLEVSERTIYRDIVDLQSTGVPIDGEAGVGYVMRGGFDLPPLMFTHDEIVALVTGARIVRSWGGVTMARAAEEALIKIEAVLPEKERDRAANTQIFAPYMGISEQTRKLIDQCEAAVEARNILAFDYRDEAGAATNRNVHPLGLWFWGKVWTLVAWCELRKDFRMFRIDRMADVKPAGRNYKPMPDRSLAEFLRQNRSEIRATEIDCMEPRNTRFEAHLQSQIDLLNAGKPLEAFDRFFAPSGRMFANDALFANGAKEGREKQEPYIAAATSISGLITDLKILTRKGICVFRNRPSFSTADGNEHRIDGLCWQQWRDGQIVEERYYDRDQMKALIDSGILHEPGLLEKRLT